MKKCEGCGHYASCFGCKPGTGLVRRSLRTELLIPMYRHTKQLTYRKINI